jgi:hypothetical protein
MQFLYIYYSIIGISFCMLPLYLRRRSSHDIRLLIGVIGTLVSLVYLLGMMRSDGIDLDIYRASYEDSYENSIPDLGFRLLIHLLNAMHLPFEVLMLIIGATSILAIKRLCKSFHLSFVLLLLLWFLHFAVVRDFAQTRIGFAIALAMIALTSSSYAARLTLYALAISMHLTSAVFVLAYEACLYIARQERICRRITGMVVLIALIFLTGNFINVLGILDERINLYLNWDREGYGLPVAGYGTLLLHSVIVFFAIIYRKHWSDDVRLRAIFYLEILGISVFIAFFDFAIFAFRLSNVLVSLYPVLIVHCLMTLYATNNKISLAQPVAVVQAYFIVFFLLFRPGSYEILTAISIG